MAAKQKELITEEPMIAEPNQLAVVSATPMTIIQNAVASGIGADELEKLLAMQERWEANRAREAYNAAMSEAQREMPGVIRDKLNSHLKSKYARLETVDAAIKPVYSKHGFSLSFGTLPDALPDHCHISCECRHSGGHVEKFEGNFPLDLKGLAGGANKTPIQAMGSTISYARRYLTLMIFNVAVLDEDNDGNGAGAERINEGEIAAINKELERIFPDDRAGVVMRMLTLAEVETIPEIPKTKFQLILKKLRAKADEYSK
jgi:hypothetical protein